MLAIRHLRFFALIAMLLGLCACGGGSNSSSSSGNTTGPTIRALSPSSTMVNVPIGGITLLGDNFSTNALIQIDGQPVNTVVFDSHTAQANVPPDFGYSVANHQIVIQQGSATSNAFTFSVYAPQPGPFVMNAIPGFLVGPETNPPWIAIADIDGDGFADVLMPNDVPSGSGGIAILKGKSDGSLAAPSILSMPTPIALMVGDVDGDGIPDLVTVTEGTNSTVSVLRGDGHGNFSQVSSTQEPPFGLPISGGQLVDIDGDGMPDLLLPVSQANAVNLVWLRNTGSGFSSAIVLATMNGVGGSFSIGDLNGDGKPDIIYPTMNAVNGPIMIHTLLNQGAGQFTDTVTSGLNGIGGIPTLIDFNLDGIPDLVVQSIQNTLIQLYAFKGNGDGSFQQVSGPVAISPPGYRVYTFVAGDFDHDGFPDLAGTDGETEPSHILYLFGDGQGNFTPKQVVGPMGALVAEGDINGDGLPDVIAADEFSFVSVALGRSDRQFPSAVSLSPAVASTAYAGDINGDGLQEIFVSGANSAAGAFPGTVFQNLGNDSFQFIANTSPNSFMLADLTGKGVEDLIGTSSSGLVIWPNNGTFGFSSSPITLPPVNSPITVADMDGDGHPDIVAPGEILYGNGSYQFTEIATPNEFGAGPYAIGDFTGDGKLDIAFGGGTLINTGGRTFKFVQSNAPLSNGAISAVGDFNGDGKADIAISLPGEQSIAIFFGQSDGTFLEGTELDAGQYPGGLVAADFDGDGRTDLAAGLMLSQQAVIFFNQGSGQFTRSYFATGADTISLTGADLNHRGKTDLIFTNFGVNFRPPNVDVIPHK